MSNQTKLDVTDLEILRILSEDSSKPFVDIAKKIGVTDGTIHQRVRKLKKSGAIKRFTVELNNEIIGKGSLAYAIIIVDPGYIEIVSEQISKYSHIIEVHEVHTQGQLLIKLRASSDNEIRDIIVGKIRKIKGVANTEVLPVYKIWKEQNTLLL
ncbi:MAG: Lrp/AsnC family transcriptional regulator [Candidatus Bathyarchaeia archaeon]